MAIGLLANAWFVWTTDTRLEQQLAEICAAGDPLTLADLVRPPIPPEKNAYTYLRRVEGYCEAIDEELWANDGFKQWSLSSGPMPSECQKIVKAAIEAHPKVIQLLQRAAGCQGYNPDFDYTLSREGFLETQLFPRMVGIRACGRVLRPLVYLLVAEGKYDDAARTGLLLFPLARHFDHNPTINSYLVALVIRGVAVDSVSFVLQSGPTSQNVRNAIDSELALDNCMAGFVWAVKSERAYGIESFGTFPFRNSWLVNRGRWNHQELDYLDTVREFLPIASELPPYRRGEETIRQIEAQRGISTGVFAKQCLGLFGASYEAVTRTRAQIRCLRVLNALQTHVSVGSDEVPKLSKLGLPAETTTDPFTGEPLKVKKTPRGWLVYSVGMNLRDDGGKIDYPSNSDVGVGPPPEAKAIEK